MTDATENADPIGRREVRALLLRAVAADHAIGNGMTLPQLVAYACQHGLRTEEERSQAIADALADE